MINIDKASNFELSPDFFKISSLVYPLVSLNSDNSIEFELLFSELNPYFQKAQAVYHVIKDKTRCVLFLSPEIKYNNKPAAYFGYFEAIDCKQSVNDLFAECESWLKSKNINYLIGPINFNTYHRYRLNLDQENPLPFLNEPQNPPYYPQLLIESGFEILNSYCSYLIYSQEKLKDWYEIYSKKAHLMDFKGYEFKFITPDLWMEKIEEIHEKSEMVFGDNFSYTPIDIQSFKIKYGEYFARLICPHTSLLVFNNGEIVGATINFPNYYELLAQGMTLSEIDIDLYFEKSNKPTLLLKTVGMMKDHAKMGFLMIRMMLEIAPNAFKYYKQYICCLMQDENYPSKLAAEFSDHTKRYALYIKKI